jgi:6,7-dimethyl-8-ribityllumazine synthase
MKGDTIHDEVIAYTVFPAIDAIARAHNLPIGNGVLTVASEAQALDRADPARQNRGGEAAKAAVRMLEIRKMALGK